MNKSKLIRGATLIMFICLLGVFVAYRTGKLDNYFASHDNIPAQASSVLGPSEGGGMLAVANTTSRTPSDSPPHYVVNPETLKTSPAMISSSKAMVLIPQEQQLPIKDSPKYLKDSAYHIRK